MATQTWIDGGTIVTMDPERRVIADGKGVVGDDVGVWGGGAAEWGGDAPDARVIDARGCVVVPGLIDAHNHPIHFLSKGIADDLELSIRSYQRVWPFEAALTDEEAYVSALGTFAEMLSHGTTCFADPGSLHPHAVARAAAD